MSEVKASRSHDAARARLRERVAALTDDERLREALRLHDELVALRREFAEVRPITPGSEQPR